MNIMLFGVYTVLTWVAMHTIQWEEWASNAENRKRMNKGSDEEDDENKIKPRGRKNEAKEIQEGNKICHRAMCEGREVGNEREVIVNDKAAWRTAPVRRFPSSSSVDKSCSGHNNFNDGDNDEYKSYSSLTTIGTTISSMSRQDSHLELRIGAKEALPLISSSSSSFLSSSPSLSSSSLSSCSSIIPDAPSAVTSSTSATAKWQDSCRTACHHPLRHSLSSPPHSSSPSSCTSLNDSGLRPVEAQGEEKGQTPLDHLPPPFPVTLTFENLSLTVSSTKPSKKKSRKSHTREQECTWTKKERQEDEDKHSQLEKGENIQTTEGKKEDKRRKQEHPSPYSVKAAPIPVLKDVGGCIRPGTMMALMGPSRMKNTALLDVLAGRKTFYGRVSGSISYNGAAVSPALRPIFMAYVEEAPLEVYSPYMTPLDILVFSAALRLPQTYSSFDPGFRPTLIRAMLSLFRLEQIQDTFVGRPDVNISFEVSLSS